jgi:hypothetical protein
MSCGTVQLLSLRRPRRRPTPPAAGDEGNKLPVLVYFHGGGYCIGTCDQPMFRSFCSVSASPTISPMWCSLSSTASPRSTVSLRPLRTPRRSSPGCAPAPDVRVRRVRRRQPGPPRRRADRLRQIALGPVRLVGYILFSAFFCSDGRTAATEQDPRRRVCVRTLLLSDVLFCVCCRWVGWQSVWHACWRLQRRSTSWIQ